MRYNWSSLKHPGRYGDPPNIRVWAAQLLSWSGVLLVMKCFVGLAIYIFSAPLGLIGELLFYPVHHHPKIELLIVMIGCPLVMNMVQFWIQDSFLMDHTNAVHDVELNDEEVLPLLSAKGTSPARAPHQHQRSPMRLNGAIPHHAYTKQHAPPQKKNSFTNAATAADMYEDL